MRLLHVRLPPRRSLGSTIAPYWRRPCGARTRLRPSEVRCPNGWAIGRLGSRSCACNRALFTRDCTSSRSRRPSRAGHHCRARRASPVSDRLFLWCECSKGPAIVAARTHPTGSLRVFDYDVVSPRCYGLRSGLWGRASRRIPATGACFLCFLLTTPTLSLNATTCRINAPFNAFRSNRDLHRAPPPAAPTAMADAC